MYKKLHILFSYLYVLSICLVYLLTVHWTVVVYKENFWNRNLLSYFVNNGQIQSQ